MSYEKFPCFECDPGEYVRAKVNYRSYSKVLGWFLVTDVPIFRCTHCKHEVLGEEGNLFIEAHIDRLKAERGVF
jgi:hypothetical protein